MVRDPAAAVSRWIRPVVSRSYLAVAGVAGPGAKRLSYVADMVRVLRAGRLAAMRRHIRQHWPAARPAGRRSWLAWPLLGLLLLMPGLALPWLAVPLRAGRSAWSLPVILAGMPALSWVTYGTVTATCLGLALLAMMHSQGRPSPATAAVGAALLAVSLTFLMTTATADWPLLQQLMNQTAQQTAIFSQFGYAVPGQAPSVMLLIPVTGTWALVGGALRLGWFCIATGGLVLFWSGAASLVRWLRETRWPGRLLPALAVLLLLGVLGRGVAATRLAARGIAASRAGDYQAARTSLAVARQLNPLLISSRSYELALGQVQLAAGGRQPLALLAAAAARGAGGNTWGEVADLRRAAAGDPANPVLVQQLDQASQMLALHDQNPGSLRAVSDPTAADMYTEGRIFYSLADYPAALVCFRRVLSMTGDANVDSSAFTYIGLSQLKLGHADLARQELLRAVRVDAGYNNTLARSLVAGLYISTKSGDA